MKFVSAAIRAELLKINGVHSLVMLLSNSEARIQSTATFALGRYLQDGMWKASVRHHRVTNQVSIIEDGRTALAKEPAEIGLNRLIELVGSEEVDTCRNAAYALSNAAQLGRMPALAVLMPCTAFNRIEHFR